MSESDKQKLPQWQLDATKPDEYHAVQVTRGREFMLRMNTGADPVLAIQKFAKDNGIRFGKVHAAYMGGFKPCKYLIWAPDTAHPGNWHHEEIAEVQNLSMLTSIGGMIGERPRRDGDGVEPFVALHFVAGAGWNVPTFTGHMVEGTIVSGCMQVFITELLDLEVEKPVDLYGISYTYPENWYRYTGK